MRTLFIMDLQAVDFSYVRSAGADANTAYDKFEHQGPELQFLLKVKQGLS